MLTREDIDAMRQTIKTGVQVVAVPQLFETPRDLAQRMADEVLEPDEYAEGLRGWNANDMRILEPSAGLGMLVGALGASWHPDGELVAVEFNGKLCERLNSKFPLTTVIHDDFLSCGPDDIRDTEFNQLLGYFDRIIMNPPFINGSDIKHIKHALTMLKPGGRLVAICANGPRQRDQLMPLAEDSGGYWEDLPAGTFSDKGANVNTALVVIEGT